MIGIKQAIMNKVGIQSDFLSIFNPHFLLNSTFI